MTVLSGRPIKRGDKYTRWASRGHTYLILSCRASALAIATPCASHLKFVPFLLPPLDLIPGEEALLDGIDYLARLGAVPDDMKGRHLTL